MTTVNFNLLYQDTRGFLTVYPPSGTPLVASTESHGNFDDLVVLARAGDVSVFEKFDVQRAVASAFDKVSTRVAVRDGVVYFDGDPVDNALTNQIFRFYDTGEDDYMPLVHFFEKVAANPQEHSREQLYRWLEKHDFPLTENGDIIAYKGVQAVSDGTYTSISSGTAVVNGVEHKGRIPNAVGDVVEMPRSAVQHDPSVGCHTGLHAGTWDYASGFARGAVMTVVINPMDVVSVPTDCDDQKVRVCRYTVDQIVDGKIDGAVARKLTDDEVEAMTEEEWADLVDDDECDEDCEDCAYDREQRERDNAAYADDFSMSVAPVDDTPIHTAVAFDTRNNYKSQVRGPDGKFVKNV